MFVHYPAIFVTIQGSGSILLPCPVFLFAVLSLLELNHKLEVGDLNPSFQRAKSLVLFAEHSGTENADSYLGLAD
ncbi:MAG: hypothetical protein F6K48_07645 [Okeania sp. SIO3H1]|nr:hypothetical protein [Okeania sp. SIO3H1]